MTLWEIKLDGFVVGYTTDRELAEKIDNIVKYSVGETDNIKGLPTEVS